MEYKNKASDRVNRRNTLYYRPCLRRNQTAITKKIEDMSFIEPIFLYYWKEDEKRCIAIYPAF